MPAGLVISLRRSCQPIVMVAVWLLALQVFVTGVAAAQAAVHALNPSNVGVICHGMGDAAPAEGTAPEPNKARPMCCTFCVAAPPAGVLGAGVVVVAVEAARNHDVALVSLSLVIAPRAVRAGLSQGPPSID